MYIIFLAAISSLTFASTSSICGPTDDRVAHVDARIGRIGKPGVIQRCTATLIGRDCAITAGHCVPLLKFVEFNTPDSKDGVPQPSEPEDFYEVDQDSLIYHDRGPSRDWAVFKLKKNAITNKLPGINYGYFKTDFSKPAIGEELSIAGYGRDTGDKNYTLQYHRGHLKAILEGNFDFMLMHNIDTMSGNSGSSIIRVSDQTIVGIHTHSNCSTNPADEDAHLNRGTSFYSSDVLQEAIKLCVGE